MAKEHGFYNLIERAFLRDGDTIHTGEALVLACLLHCDKKRERGYEEQLKQIMRVYGDGEIQHN